MHTAHCFRPQCPLILLQSLEPPLPIFRDSLQIMLDQNSEIRHDNGHVKFQFECHDDAMPTHQLAFALADPENHTLCRQYVGLGQARPSEKDRSYQVVLPTS